MRSLIICLLLIQNIDAFNYLLISPVFGFSHIKFMSKIADVLANGGHNVTIFRPHHNDLHIPPRLIKNPNIEILDYYPKDFDEMKKGSDDMMKSMWLEGTSPLSMAISAIQFGKGARDVWNNTNYQILTDKELHEKLKARKFDSVITEIFDTSGFYLNEILKIPSIVAVWSAVRHWSTEMYYGGVSPVGYVPGKESAIGANAVFLDRLNDLSSCFFIGLLVRRLILEQHYNYANIIGTNKTADELLTKSPFFMVNSNPYLDFPMPVPQTIVQIGGFTMDLKHSPSLENLPKEYDKILNEKDTTIFISFGSVAKSSEMPEHYKKGIIGMFKLLSNVTFIWKYEKEHPEMEKILPSNVHLQRWVPQPALIADKRVKLFVTHGGLGSTMEVAYSGKPALLIPIFADQPHNAMMIARHGGAEVFEKEDLVNSKKLAAVIQKMITNSIYKKHAEQLAHLLRHQPFDPKDILLSHAEFAARFPNMESLVPPILQSSFIGYYYIDVMLFLAALALISLFAVVKSILWVYRRIDNIISRSDALPSCSSSYFLSQF
ncbi:unnamed protein product [Caenorhabditis bovis]|uniref:glucuronosyltransferase n=1 Tax=Caenorhabditis bovis TaxID=2654633 RepID=A0A8S1E986_9PELO|nr:unnamed protein product [Caenorhabditis bovis]